MIFNIYIQFGLQYRITYRDKETAVLKKLEPKWAAIVRPHAVVFQQQIVGDDHIQQN